MLAFTISGDGEGMGGFAQQVLRLQIVQWLKVFRYEPNAESRFTGSSRVGICTPRPGYIRLLTQVDSWL
jgi:hypothetical protein